MYDFMRIILFCLEKRLSKHKMTIFPRTKGGAWPLRPPWLAFPFNLQQNARFLGEMLGKPNDTKKRIYTLLKLFSWILQRNAILAMKRNCESLSTEMQLQDLPRHNWGNTLCVSGQWQPSPVNRDLHIGRRRHWQCDVRFPSRWKCRLCSDRGYFDSSGCRRNSGFSLSAS